MNVLSLFDGMSCGQLALRRAGIKVDKYYASEIDKYAIQITQKNYPQTIQLGDIRNIRSRELSKIHLLIGGSPCQGFSFEGKQLNFQDPRSKLFFEFVRIKNECNPDIFLLENVKMKKEYQDIISSYLGVEPIEINSALCSAQNRRRLYWTNLSIQEPEDRSIYLDDILDSDIPGILVDYNQKGEFSILAKNKKIVRLDNKTVYPHSIYESRTELGKQVRSHVRKEWGKDFSPRGTEYKEYRPLGTKKSNCITATPTELDYIVDKEGKYRMLTLEEMERLQTLPTSYTKGVSDYQRRLMIGNGWTINVITYLFKALHHSEIKI